MARLQLRRATTSAWANRNPILADGEEGYDKSQRRRKVGDGVRAWLDLPYEDAENAQAESFTYHRDVAAATWTIQHNLGAFKVPTIILDNRPGEPVWTDVELPNVNTAVLIFPSPVTGYAYFN